MDYTPWLYIVLHNVYRIVKCIKYQIKHGKMKEKTMSSGIYKASNKSTELTCKLTSSELQNRKITVLEKLRKQIIDKKELQNGYAFKFPGTDNLLDRLTEFVKTERTCCNFFIFTLSISGDKSEMWLELTGPKGAKNFIVTELGL